MTTTVFRRPPRLAPPTVPGGDMILQPPPDLPRPDGGNAWLTALPALSGLGSVAYMFAGPANPITYVAGSMFLFSSLAMVGGSVLRSRTSTKGSANQSRADYLRYLRRTRSDVRQVAAAQRELALWRGPDPEQLWTITTGPRLWERRSGDPDFGLLRLGTGPQSLVTPLVTGETGPIEELDPLSATALRRFVVTHSVLPDTPMMLASRRLGAVRLGGPRAAARDLGRAVLVQAAAFHAPEDLRIAICTRDPDADDWSWAKWLPHAQLPDETDNVGPTRLITSSLAALEEMLGTELARRPRFNRAATPDPDVPHLLVLIDGGRVDGAELLLDSDGLQAVTILDLDGVAEELTELHGMSVAIDDGKIAQRIGSELVWLGRVDAVGVPLAESLARQLAGVRLDTAAAQGEDLGSTDNSLPGLLGIADPGELDLERLWRPRPVRDRLRTPIGPSADGTVLELDIKESAQDGMGPHGLVIGATGSGKSELLRTLVLGMATTHSSDVLNLVLVDFKGGATFAGMADLPHVAAVITNLENDLTMVDRMREALSGELNRRQEVLRDAGNLVSIRDYDRARLQGANLAPLPSLWVVVDEFSELLAQKPDFSELFVQIGRLGRSLGVHLLLASQRIDEGRLRGLESHLSYRIGLRTFSESESRAVLGVPDAYTLPSSPGHGYLKADTSGLRRFRAAYVSGPYRPSESEDSINLLPGSEVRPFTASYQPVLLPEELTVPAAQEIDDDPSADETSMLEVMVGQLIGLGNPAHQVWLPPLDAPDTLDRLLLDLQVRPGRGFGANPATAPLTVPIGLVDLPFQQRRDPFTVDLGGSAGNVAIVGGPRSGKSTILRTILAALALRHTPAEVQFYCLDFSGGALFGLAGLPHVGGVAGRQDGDVARRIVAEIAALVERRESTFRALGVDSMTGYRQARLDGRTDDPYGDVFVLVDGWAVLRQEFEDLEAELMALAGRALTYGVHLVVTANRWLDLRLGLRDLVGGKLELKLGDALDSEIDRKAQQIVPAGRPGRGVTPDKLQYLAALPRVDGVQSADDLSAGIANLVDLVRDNWRGAPAPLVRLLPTELTLAELPAETTSGQLIIGMEGLRLRPVALDPHQDQGLVVLGDAESGKTSLLRSIARQVTSIWQPAEAKIVIFDFRRSLLGEFSGESLLSYAATAQQAVDTVAGLVEGFQKRLPTTDVTPEQLRTRSWWTGPEIYILVDDYDLVTSGQNPLVPLVEYLAQARDIGLQLVIARRAGGASRALMDPVVGRLRELGQPAIVLSAPRDEGTLFGVRPSQQPPGRGMLVHRRYGTVPIQLIRADY